MKTATQRSLSDADFAARANKGVIRTPSAWLAEQFLSRQFPPKEPLVQGLLHRRDLVAFGARRRHGKTSFITNLAVALAIPVPDFLGYGIPAPRRSLLLILEDDPGEYQEKLRRVVGGRDIGNRIMIMTREDFYKEDVLIQADTQPFRSAVNMRATEHHPDLIVIDNLAQVIEAEYNDAKRVHELMRFSFNLARSHNAAIILPAHPKKEDPEHRTPLQEDPDGFFESIMGTSHFINSAGSLWGLERDVQRDRAVFLGGRQRGDGNQGHSVISMDDNGWFHLLDEGQANVDLVLNTMVRRQAWKLLPEPPKTFGYREGEDLVRSAMRSSSTYAAWIRECRRLKVMIDTDDGKLMKKPGLKPLIP
jgi:hypothetical protein